MFYDNDYKNLIIKLILIFQNEIVHNSLLHELTFRIQFMEYDIG